MEKNTFPPRYYGATEKKIGHKYQIFTKQKFSQEPKITFYGWNWYYLMIYAKFNNLRCDANIALLSNKNLW